jgi:hypothetical protein
MENAEEPPKKRRGRPPGSHKKLLPLGKLSTWDKYTTPPMMDYRHEDVQTLVGRQLSMVGLAQDRIRQEMLGEAELGEPHSKIRHAISLDDVERLNNLSNALVRSINALQIATKVAEELKNKMTPEQTLNAAVELIKKQDLATVTEIIKKLAYRRKTDPRHNKNATTRTVGAADGIADLED